MLAFLDQFISRGAADDLRDLRERLATRSEVQQRLDRQLGGDEVSEREAFDAMRRFLQEEPNERATRTSGEPDVFDLLSWTEWEPDGGTSDPAQWHDWVAAVSSTAE